MNHAEHLEQGAQEVRKSHNPKKWHATALHRIIVAQARDPQAKILWQSHAAIGRSNPS
jgi:hypothetical protein